MTIQTDDIVTRQEDIFKGNEHFAMPFDARYGAWVVGVILSATTTVTALKLFLPAFQYGGPLAVIASLIVAVTAATPAGFFFHKQRPDRWKLLTVATAVVVFMPMFSIASNGGPRGSLVGLAMAVAYGTGGSVLAVRAGGKYVDAVTPWRYRLAVATAELHAPRPTPPVSRTITAGTFVEDTPPTSHIVLPPIEKVTR